MKNLIQVSVKDRQPEQGGIYLVTVERPVWGCNYKTTAMLQTRYFGSGKWDVSNQTVTHWWEEK